MAKDRISFFEEDTSSGLKNRLRLKSYLIDQTHQELILDRVQLTYIFCTDEALMERNIQFLNHDTFTDIITFDLGEKEDELVGEIYISVDRVKENAEKYGVTIENELHRVIFHGWLHLLGYNDKDDSQAQEMRRMEDKHLNQYFNI